MALLIGTIGFAEETRSWTSSATGRQFKGALVKVEGDAISIRRESDQAVFQVKTSDLIQEDLDWIKENLLKEKSVAQVEDLSDLIAGIPASTGTPAVGVLLVLDGEVRGMGVAGLRKAGDNEIVKPGDKWHLGSCTKSMTATLAATLVEEGAITWETTVSEILGKELKMLEEYESVTLGVLLANRSGIPGSFPDSVPDSIEQSAKVTDLKDRDILQQRAQYVEAVLNVTPAFAPNSAYEYSNSGFVVAGAMLEEVTGKPWEKLIEERIFEPLGMEDSGFGNAAREDKNNPSQPWPHENGTTPVDPGSGDDNSWVIGPAGTVHCSLKDMARYLSMHAAREIGPVLKKPETYEFLHTAVPDNNDYARGWIVTRTGWSGGAAISHDGSNTMNHCSVWVAPEKKSAVAAFVNTGAKGSDACRSAIQLVVEKYMK
ncbi:MAG: serine hydrolase [Verrucomicrobiales bacterium]|nr:serine hydrolase [Verrucomicrobiales bacterium]